MQFLDRVERSGLGWNLCLQSLDGILCHDGEIHNQTLEPSKHKSFDILDIEIENKKKKPAVPLTPMTLEGCVVRMADTISYIGRDIEDAIRLGIIDRSDIPRDCIKRLGDTNGSIVYSLVTDIIEHSFDRSYIAFSRPVSVSLIQLNQFNLDRIYLNPRIKKIYADIRTLFNLLFERYLKDIQQGNGESVIFSAFLNNKSDVYMNAHMPEEFVRDFIAGMTDRFFLRQFPPHMRPELQTSLVNS